MARLLIYPQVGYYPVIAVWSHLDPLTVYLTIDGEQIETTPEHPFYTSEGEWKPAATLQPGDKIRQADGSTGEVEAVRVVVRPQEMYNFTVATAHTYFVGEGRWLVHNTCIDKIKPSGWSPMSPQQCKSGCEAIAEKIQGFMGGEIYRITDASGAPRIGKFDGFQANWSHHDIVIKDGMVYDAFTGSQGQLYADYIKRFEYAQYLTTTLISP